MYFTGDHLIRLLDKLIERSDRWIEDATERTDWNDVSFYEGQKKAFNEIKQMYSE